MSSLPTDPLPTKRRYSLISHDTARELTEKNLLHTRTILSLTQQLSTQKQKSHLLSLQLDLWKNRLLERQKQLREILHQTQTERDQIKDMRMGRGRIPTFVSNLHQEINCRIERAGEEMGKMMGLREKSRGEYFESKLEGLRREMEGKIKREKSLTRESLGEIFGEIEELKGMAGGIDEENTRLGNEVRELRIKNKILVEERNMAIRESVVNTMKMKELQKQKRGESRLSSRVLPESKRHKSDRKTPGYSLTVSQQYPSPNIQSTNNHFLGQPIFDSPKHPSPTEQQSSSPSKNPKQKSTLFFQRSLRKDRNKNIDISSLISDNKMTNSSQLSPTLKPILESRQSTSNTFGCFVLETSMNNESVLKTLEKYNNEEEEFQIRPKQATIDLSDLKKYL